MIHNCMSLTSTIISYLDLLPLYSINAQHFESFTYFILASKSEGGKILEAKQEAIKEDR